MLPIFAVPIRPADRFAATDAPMEPLTDAFRPNVGFIEAAAEMLRAPVAEVLIPREAKGDEC